MRFRDKVKKPRRPVVVYEILPPREQDGTLSSYAERISSLLSQTHIDAINIPEVHDEEGRGNRPVQNQLRAEPREFGRLLQDNVGVEAIVNRVVVHEPMAAQQQWLKETYYDYGIDNLVIVGGESHETSYPGPGVNESTRYITRELNGNRFDYFCGGIAIPSRKAESRRLLAKSRHGIEFFTSQVLYDSKKIRKVLGHYQQRCDAEGTFPRRILLSFAPVSSPKNVEFLKWLGVEIPAKTEKYLLEAPDEMAQRSTEIASGIMREILDHVSEAGLRVPIGLNVEHIMSYNFQASITMLQELARDYREFCIRTNLYG